MKQEKWEQFATKKELENLKKEVRQGFDFAYKKFIEHDERFDRIESKLDKTIDSIQQMCDKVMKGYIDFSVESVAIRGNYQHLESRVYKVEKVVFPNQHQLP